MPEESEEIKLIGNHNISGKFKKMVSENQRSLIFKNNPTIYFINLPAGFKGEEEVHGNEDDMYYVFEGGGELLVQNKDANNRFDSLKIKKGDFVHIPSKTVHKLSYTEKGIKYIVIKIRNK